MARARTNVDLCRQVHLLLTKEQAAKLERVAGKLCLGGQGPVLRMLVERLDESALVDAVSRAATGKPCP